MKETEFKKMILYNYGIINLKGTTFHNCNRLENMKNIIFYDWWRIKKKLQKGPHFMIVEEYKCEELKRLTVEE